MSTVCTMGSLGTHRRVRSRRILVACLIACAGVVLAWKAITLLNWNPRFEIGQERDRLNGVAVYHNGGVDHSSGRHLSPDGYNLGIKYQCVEFVKRYYYQRLNHMYGIR